jgi:hypothetical protein
MAAQLSGSNESNMVDIRHNRGYQRLATYMAQSPSQAIFSRFRSANMLALLLMQAEITELEEELDVITLQDNFSKDENRENYCNNWTKLRGSGPSGEQWQKIQALKEKVLEYSK